MDPSLAARLGNDPVLWRQELAGLAGDVVALDSDDTFKWIESGIVGNPPALAGETLNQARALGKTVNGLFLQYSLLNDRVKTAEAAAATVARWIPGHPAMQQAERALRDPIQVSSETVTPEQMPDLVPSWRQGTATVGNVDVPPIILLASWSAALSRAHDALKALGDIQREVDTTTTRARALLSGLAKKAETLGLTPMPEIVSAMNMLSIVEKQATADPIGARATVQNDVLTVLERARQEIDRVGARRLSLSRRLDEATAVLQQLDAARRRYVQSDEVAEKVIVDKTRLVPPAVTDAQMDDLRQWLARLEMMSGAGAWRAVERPLEAWFAQANPLVESAVLAASANASPLDRLRMLRGRLHTYQQIAVSTMGMVAIPGTPAGDAAAIYKQAQASLTRSAAQPQIDLDRAEALVEQYATMVDSPRNVIR